VIRIREAQSEDRDLILPLLNRFNNPYVDEAGWSRLFSDPWKTGEGCGMVMTDDGRAVGYLGLLFSRPVIGGEVHPLANLTSWIVEEPYRKHSLGLLLPILKLPHTLTDFTPSPDVYRLLARAGFRNLDSGYRFLFPLPRTTKRCRIITEPDAVRPLLSEADRTRFDDHQALGIKFFQLHTPEGDCVIALSSLSRKKPPYRLGEVLYLNRPDLFATHSSELVSSLCRLLRVFTLFCDERFLGGRVVAGSIRRSLDPPRQFRSNSLHPEDVSGMYSELAVLGL
jgi:hypothetical protein